MSPLARWSVARWSGPLLAVTAALSWSCGSSQKTSPESGAARAPDHAPTAHRAAAETPAADRGAAGAGPSVAVGAAGERAVPEDWQRRADLIMAMFRAMFAAARAHPTDCDAFAAALVGIIDEHPEAIAAGQSMESDRPFKDWFESTHDDGIEADLASMIARMLECKGNPTLQQALKKLDS